MTAPAVVVVPDAEALARRGAEEFVARAQATLAGAPVFRVALAGGSTPRRLFEILAADFRAALDWTRVEIFFGDERCVPLDDPDSNFRMARETLLVPLGLPPAHVHALDARRGARAYQEEIARAFGVPADGPPPAFDLVLLGMGPDGHTASLFPHNAALREERAWVVDVHDAPKPPPDRVSLTPAILNRAHAVVFLVSDAGKADSLAAVLEGPREPERYPAQRIAPAGTLRWLVDRAAAGRLSRR